MSDEISQDFEHALKVIRELGAGYVELRTLWNRYVVELSDVQIHDIKSLIDRYGIKVSHVCSPTFKIYINDEVGYREHLAILRRAIEISKFFNLGYTRVFTFWWQGSLDLYIDKIVEKFQPAIELAEKEGIFLIIENEYSCFIGTGSELQQFLEKLKSKWVKVLWDPGNAFFARETPYPYGYNKIKDHVLYMHLKDASVENGKFVFKPIGKGMIDYEGQLKDVINKGIILSLETHYTPRSGSKEEGTRESYTGLINIIKKIEGG
ncbi:MAG: sugar phosphate isomerase/epimerase [Ignisphaera sp.]|nr:sugar phosphate isomerase/epimerase [Ignisphaera sp.]MCX8167757.1 sugar phosphate isomerase/epimerase [Ignisphaera sp.]MDW8085256.1 sugar phosphate isomerase/epimerase family protein [Ignisphaera sp.]